jgi:magnesium transporter
MNFHDMPELAWPHAYAGALSLMVISTIGTFWYFKKKKWF